MIIVQTQWSCNPEGGGVYSHFSPYLGWGPASTVHTKKKKKKKKKKSGISSTPKFFEIFATPKNIPRYVKCIEMTPKYSPTLLQVTPSYKWWPQKYYERNTSHDHFYMKHFAPEKMIRLKPQEKSNVKLSEVNWPSWHDHSCWAPRRCTAPRFSGNYRITPIGQGK